jgi:hypothetical protein
MMTVGEAAAFLLRAAEELRALASLAPEIAAHLRQMAEDCEAEAVRLRQGDTA